MRIDDNRPERVAYYRRRSAEALRQVGQAPCRELREAYYDLAIQLQHLAQKNEIVGRATR